VLLVDADVSKGGVTEQLGIQAHRGLSDLLYETNYIGEDSVLTSNIERLSILPAGGNTDQVDELFASDLMSKITRELALADPDRIVLFDAPPLLATTEAAVLARHMGQVVVVVEANKTPQDAVAHSVAQLEGCAKVSMILNKTSQRDSGAYGYGYGYAQGKRRPAEASQTDRDEAEVASLEKELD
jgi:receptor protein-tyrosine kinase